MIGKAIGQYRIVGRLGTGGMGVVYEAQDDLRDRRVALKLLSDDVAADATAIRHLRREAEILAGLNNPHICAVLEIGDAGGRPFIVMERLQGHTLRASMVKRRPTTGTIVDVAGQIANALSAAHDRGIVHRDIKPGNVFVDADGFVKVLDFGLARRIPLPIENEDVFGSTIVGRPIGTANYMAPERILQAPLDARCDLFSLGVVMYEMATGRLPFAAASPAEVVTNVLEREPTPVQERAPEHSPAFAAIVMKLMAKRAEDRYQTAAEFRAALDAMGVIGRSR